MRKRKQRKQPSLEQELKRLASEKIKKDPRGRTRAELLAASLWNRSLAGDRDSLRLLLERLPVTVPQDAEPAMAESKHSGTSEAKMDQVVNAFKELVDAGIVPIEVFEQYRIKRFEEQYEDGNPNLTKTVQ